MLAVQQIKGVKKKAKIIDTQCIPLIAAIFFQTKPVRIIYYVSDTRCCTRHSSNISR